MVNEIVIPSLYLLAGILSYATVYHFSVALNPPRNLAQMLFAGMCLLAVPFALFHALELQASNPPDFIWALRWNLAFAFMFFLLLIWFIALYTGKRQRHLLAGLSILFAVLFVANLAQPNSFQYEHLDGIRTLHLSWGETVTRGVGQISVFWVCIGVLGVMMTFGYVLYALYDVYRRYHRRTDWWMMLAIGLFLISVSEGILARLSELDFIELGPFGILAMVLVMSISLSIEMQQRLRTSERHFRLLFENIPAGMVSIDPKDGRILDANQFVLKLFGYSAEEFFTKTVDDLTSFDDKESSRQRYEKLFKGLVDHIEYEKRYIKKDGSSFLGYSSLSTLKDEKGEITSFIGSTVDITDRKLAEITLRRESEKNLAFLRNASDGIHILDANGNIIEVSDSFCSMLGYRRDEMIGMNVSRWDAQFHETELLRLVRQQFARHERSEFETSHKRKDGTIFDAEVSGVALELEGKPVLFNSSRDITERKRVEKNLRISASVFENTREAILITDPDNAIIDVNSAFIRITGFSREEVIGKDPIMLSSGQQGKEFYAKMWESLKQESAWRGELSNRRKTGEIYQAIFSISTVRDSDGKVQRYVGVFSDISHIKKHEAELQHIAHFDMLTGIPNRALLVDRMKQAIAQTAREHNMMAVCYLDLDGFKLINDTLGHEAGDQILIEVSKRIVDSIRGGDTIARLGGDEFVMLLLGLEKGGECTVTLERLLNAIAQPITIKNRNLTISASIGVSLYPLDDEEPDILLRHADQAMYVAKQAGKNRFHIYDYTLDQRARDQNEFIKKIRYALEHGQFELFYQPKINLRTKQLVGVEALIRWRHPERGLLSPAEFLRYIESTDLDIKIGEWVIATALAQISQWRNTELDIEVSINISGYHLESPRFTERLQQQLMHYPDMPSGKLQIEVLETVALNDIAVVRGIIEACRKLGVGFALDDFGTGYSSLSYLSGLPVDTLKIDQSFVRDMLEDKGDMAIVQGIIALARAFDRQTVAEGIETEDHYQVLLDMGCELGQGYGIARPMPAEEMTNWRAI